MLQRTIEGTAAQRVGEESKSQSGTNTAARTAGSAAGRTRVRVQETRCRSNIEQIMRVCFALSGLQACCGTLLEQETLCVSRAGEERRVRSD